MNEKPVGLTKDVGWQFGLSKPFAKLKEIDSFVLQTPPERQAPNHYRAF